MKVKLMKIYGTTIDSPDEYGEIFRYHSKTTSEWEEIDQNKFNYLYDFIHRFNHKKSDFKYIILQEENEIVHQCIDEQIAYIENQEKQQQQKLKEYKRKEIQAQEKRNAKKLEKTIENIKKDKTLLKKLEEVILNENKPQ